ncbi:AAA family ATPase [Pseudoalteromonas sp. bablab_jr004]|uniref:McrB family protein n=1 Tax=Pseudoalteromonas sp. bablab_jr004 TaxID=2755065 RepID=UPI002456C5CA|nr:AAA family ATPase [Pseudoalteromonas sp. bablab_jr004]
MLEKVSITHDVWNDFLNKWSVDSVRNMTIDEYTGLEDKDTFTYWLEHKLTEYGSIRGGSSYKFGIFRKADIGNKNSKASYSSDQKYAWLTKFGNTSTEAFENVKKHILFVIDAIKNNKLDDIETSPLSHTLKWKIAFHYQEQQSPKVVGIFSLNALQNHIGEKLPMAAVLEELSKELTYENLFDKADEIWGEWASLLDINIWKISHGKNEFSNEENQWLDENQYITVHKNTGHSQGKKFLTEAKVGDYACLSNSNLIKAIIKISSDIVIDNNSPLDDDWALRSYEVVYWLDSPKPYNSNYKKGWTPNFNSTFKKVPTAELPNFEDEILTPYFKVELSELVEEGESLMPSDEQLQNENNINENIQSPELNTILYGPPGTGKTYHSIQAAVKAAEPEFYSTLGINENIGTTHLQREKLTRVYNELFDAGRIKFVTFHQSYGYEEFVEGLSAKTEGDKLYYFEKNGVFKSLCNQAKGKCGASSFLNVGDSFGSFTVQSIKSEVIHIRKQNGSNLLMPRAIIDEVVDLVQNKSLLIDEVSAEKLRELGSNTDAYFVSGYKGLYKPLCEELIARRIKSPNISKNYVLIIDEINRGNISKIFGELITLIESSKRLGRPEAIEVTLPYSGEKFSVPENLYIIGTMNTADRSLALMDTALRRRFDFIEMMPNYSVLRDAHGQSYTIQKGSLEIDLVLLLQELNKRIVALYDREHQLGHAFLMQVVKAIVAHKMDQALIELKNCFQNKIIPLLAEYFFEDWQKIRLVLGDNQKPKAYQLINQSDVDYKVLFGDTEDLGDVADDVQDYKLIKADSELWTDPLTYIGIYSAGDLPKDEG